MKKVTGDEFTLSPLPPRKKKRKKQQQQQQRSQVVTILTTPTPAQGNIAMGEMCGGGGGGEKNESYRKKQKVIERAKTFATYCMLEILNSSNKDGVNIRICKFVNLPYI